MSSLKPCINFPKNTYSGKEQSPLRYGLSAEGYDINSAMDGYDKQVWVVEMKNNKKVWNKKDSILRITPEEPIITNSNELSNDNVKVTKVVAPKPATDYNKYVKYRLYSNINETKFELVRIEWQELKKKPEELVAIMIIVNKWTDDNKDMVIKKTRNNNTKID